MMNGIDISHWQAGMQLQNISADFVIMKATEGTYYVDPRCEEFFAAAQKSGKLCGLCHFASGSNGAVNEAKYFVEHIKDKLGKAILVLDWEAEAINKGSAYAKLWLDTVYELTGIRPLIYMSKGISANKSWAEVAKDYKLWVAQYPNYKAIYGYQDNFWTDDKGCGAWGKEGTIHQYTSCGYLPGWSGRLDLDKAFIDAYEWEAMATGRDALKPETPLKPLAEIADEVYAGKWGNGQERIRNLTDAGYDYTTVQNEVNILFWAKEVLAGKWGNGAERVRKLTNAHIDAKAVQKKVNEILEGKA